MGRQIREIVTVVSATGREVGSAFAVIEWHRPFVGSDKGLASWSGVLESDSVDWWDLFHDEGGSVTLRLASGAEAQGILLGAFPPVRIRAAGDWPEL